MQHHEAHAHRPSQHDDDARASRRESGWDLLPQFASQSEIRVLREEISGLLKAPADHPDVLYFEDQTNGAAPALARMERFWEATPSLCTGALGSRLRLAASNYLGRGVSLFKDKLNMRYPHSSGYSPHQDVAAGWDAFASAFVSLCVFFEPTGPENGGFDVATGTHRGLRFPNIDGKMSDTDFEQLAHQPIRAEGGDALLLDGEAPHRSLANRSDRAAFHAIFTFTSASPYARAAYYKEKLSSFGARAGENTFEFRVFSFESASTLL
ncbi:MAG: phytanoyl-CoA dioxygenase family protein [Vitreimonas sp.]